MSVDLRFRPWRTRPASAPRSLWLEQALARETIEPRTLEGEHRFAVCIVGGGFTGLWTAIRLREEAPSVRVAVVEADLCGSGASGRNGGGVSHWWAKLPTLVRVLGRDDAMRVVRASSDAIDEMGRFCASEGIECEFRIAPSLWSATAPGQIGAWDAVLETARELGVDTPYREVSGEELHELVGGAPYLAAVLEEHGHQVQPALLARGLRRVALDRGVEIFEASPVSRVRSASGGVSVEARQGRVLADQVVLGANAWMAHFPEFRRSVMVVSSDVMATEPIRDRLARLGWEQRPGGINARLMVNYYKVTPEGRLVIGRAGGTLSFAARIGAAFDRSDQQAREIREDFSFLFPELAGVRFTHSWAGPVDRSTTGLPWFGRLAGEPRIHYGIGYTGHGVGATVLGGRILASSVLGRDDEWTGLSGLLGNVPRTRFPPEPLRFVGGQFVRGAVARKERADRERRRASPVDVALSRLAPATIADIRRQTA